MYCVKLVNGIPMYSQTCIKRSPLGQRKSGLIRQVTSQKSFNSYEIFYGRTRKRWPFNTGDYLIKVAALTGLTVYDLNQRLPGASFAHLIYNSNQQNKIWWNSSSDSNSHLEFQINTKIIKFGRGLL